jgi:hypothetical protein
MEKDVMIKKYCEALDEGRAAIFAGAGLSVSAGYVNWAGLLKDVAKELNIKIEKHTDLVELAQYYVNETKSTHELSSAILNKFPSSTAPTINHKILASLPIDVFWTTNFDKLIENALKEADKVYDVKSLPESLAISKMDSQVTVYKMHGDVDNPDKTILTRDQFERYPDTHKAYLTNFSYDLANRTFLFLGLSFDDPNLQYVLKYARNLYHENQRVHYYILKRVSRTDCADDDDFKNQTRSQELFVEDMKNYGIQTVFIDNYAAITEILTSIKQKYLRKTIFISGAATNYSPFSELDFKEFISKLSADLIRNGFRIVNGYGLGLGNEVIAGALQELKDLHKPVDGNLIIRPFPQGLTDPSDMWSVYREEMISLTGVGLFFMGNKIDKATGIQINSPGVRSEYEISKNHNNFLVPVGMTGYMAEELYTEQMVEIKSGGTTYEAYKDIFNQLGNKSKSLDEIRDLIVQLLLKINE